MIGVGVCYDGNNLLNPKYFISVVITIDIRLVYQVISRIILIYIELSNFI
jgi:hypothetical protein